MVIAPLVNAARSIHVQRTNHSVGNWGTAIRRKLTGLGNSPSATGRPTSIIVSRFVDDGTRYAFGFVTKNTKLVRAVRRPRCVIYNNQPAAPTTSFINRNYGFYGPSIPYTRDVFDDCPPCPRNRQRRPLFIVKRRRSWRCTGVKSRGRRCSNTSTTNK